MKQKKHQVLFLFLLILCFISSISFADDSKAKVSKAKDTSKAKVTDTKSIKGTENTQRVSLDSIDWWGSQYVFVLRPGLLESLLPVAPKRPPPKMPPLPTDPRELCFHYLRQTGASFESRVTGCTQLADQILWQQPNGTRVRFSEWTRAQKDRINELYQRIQTNAVDLGVRCTVPVENVNVDYNKLYITADEAFDMYAAYIAQSIYLEGNRLVPWSLLDNPAAENQAILDSSQYFSIITETGEGIVSLVRERFRPGTAYQSPAWQYGTRSILNCDPRIPYLFLNGTYSSTRTNLLGSDQNNTIKNMSWWFHGNVYHGAGYISPISEWIRTQIFLTNILARKEVTSGGRVIAQGVDAYQGCHTASNVFLELARGVNIPIRLFWYSDQGPRPGAFNISFIHLGIAYRWSRPDARLVLHADDLYVQHKSIFPITSDERVMSLDEAKNIFFDKVWMTPAQADSWNIRYYRNLPLILPGQDVEQTLPARPDIRPDYGYYGGHNLMRQVSNNSYSSGLVPFNLERNYDTCGWHGFLQTYCEDTNPEHLESYAQFYSLVTFLYRDLSSAPPITRTIESCMDRLAVCARVNGGCETLINRVNEENRTHGGNFLRMP